MIRKVEKLINFLESNKLLGMLKRLASSITNPEKCPLLIFNPTKLTFLRPSIEVSRIPEGQWGIWISGTASYWLSFVLMSSYGNVLLKVKDLFKKLSSLEEYNCWMRYVIQEIYIIYNMLMPNKRFVPTRHFFRFEKGKISKAFIKSNHFLNYYFRAGSLKVMTPAEYNGLLSGLDIQTELDLGFNFTVRNDTV